MKRIRTKSPLCVMDEHDSCDPRWTENDANGISVAMCICSCECHSTGAKGIERLRQAAKEP